MPRTITICLPSYPEGKDPPHSPPAIHIPRPHTHTPKSLRLLVSGQNKKGLVRCVSVSGWGQGSCFKRLATSQDFNTSLEIHNGVKSTPATNYSLINSVASWADGRWFFKGQVQCVVWTVSGEKMLSGCAGPEGVCICLHVLLHTPFSSGPSLRYLCAFRPCIHPIQPRNAIGLLQCYLIVLIGAQKWLQDCSLQTYFHFQATVKTSHLLYLQIQYLNCYFTVKPKSCVISFQDIMDLGRNPPRCY